MYCSVKVGFIHPYILASINENLNFKSFREVTFFNEFFEFLTTSKKIEISNHIITFCQSTLRVFKSCP